MNELPAELLRYSRHIALPSFGERGQKRIGAASMLVVGLGGLGSIAATYLAAAGVGRLLVNDFDTVDLTNLQRQLLYRMPDIGQAKTASAGESLRILNPDIEIAEIAGRLSGRALEEAVGSADVVVDASDNFGTRFALNTVCVRTGTPLVSGAAIQYRGQITVFEPARAESPCYACLYDEEAEGLEDCAGNGVLGPVVGVIGSLQAVEALKLASGVGTPLTGRLLHFDALAADFHSSRIARDPACPVCGSTA